MSTLNALLDPPTVEQALRAELGATGFLLSPPFRAPDEYESEDALDVSRLKHDETQPLAFKYRTINKQRDAVHVPEYDDRSQRSMVPDNELYMETQHSYVTYWQTNYDGVQVLDQRTDNISDS